ncbi:MAG: AbrB/MazE/SpoVT family DNA-binding domain-containing protein [Candidatus Limnocylindrales bacterium]
MRTTIDKAGRIVVPKPMRDELGLRGGDALEITVRDRVIEIDVPLSPIHLEEREGVLVAVPEERLPTLTNEEVRATLERTRR